MHVGGKCRRDVPPGRLYGLEKGELLTAGGTEMLDGEWWANSLVQTVLLISHFKNLIDLLGKDALPAHAFMPFGIIKFTAANGADAVEDFVFLLREIFRKPILK